jgi:hypothetical protein
VTGSSILSRSNDPVPVETRLQSVLALRGIYWLVPPSLEGWK